MKILWIYILICLTAAGCTEKYNSQINVGSKKFTESVILGDLITQFAKSEKINIEHKKELGGTRILWNALLNGEIDIYPEYTGTIIQELLHGESINNFNSLKNSLKKYSVEISNPLGFNNTYAIGMNTKLADELGINNISDLAEHKELKYGFTNEFMNRNDGWPGLQKKYKLQPENVTGIDHDLAYRGLENGSIDVVDLYSTDAEIKYYNLKVLKDDLNYFPLYNAVILYRSDLIQRSPNMISLIRRLEDRINENEMINMNSDVKLNGKPEFQTASEFLSKEFNIELHVQPVSILNELLKNTKDHLTLVLISLCGAILFAVPLGVIAFKNKKTGNIILSVVGIIQTIPSLAILVFMIPFFGIGAEPAIVALFLYSLLPIVRNTYSGLNEIPVQIRESAVVLGLSGKEILRKIELPLASRSILTGIKTSAVINVGTATLGALIGAGGFGQPILTGIRLDSISLILQGAVPAALLAIIVQYLFDLSEKIIVPKGLRIDK